MAKKLKIWNGRWINSGHAYIAAYSRADAVRLLETEFGGRGWNVELKEYWHEGAWGNSMEGITPERGIWIQKRMHSKPVRYTKLDIGDV